jgi:hypothetical protein
MSETPQETIHRWLLRDGIGIAMLGAPVDVREAIRAVLAENEKWQRAIQVQANAVRVIGAKERAEYVATQTLDSQREANAMLTARLEQAEAALAERDAKVEAFNLVKHLREKLAELTERLRVAAQDRADARLRADILEAECATLRAENATLVHQLNDSLRRSERDHIADADRVAQAEAERDALLAKLEEKGRVFSENLLMQGEEITRLRAEVEEAKREWDRADCLARERGRLLGEARAEVERLKGLFLSTCESRDAWIKQCDKANDRADKAEAALRECRSLLSAVLLNRSVCFIPDDADGLYHWDERARAALRDPAPAEEPK